MQEYPKRVYKAGKGITVNSAEEEAALFGRETIVIPDDVKFVGLDEPRVVGDIKPSEDKEEEALQYIIDNGYSKTAAKRILKQQGVEKVLEAKTEGKDPQE